MSVGSVLSTIRMRSGLSQMDLARALHRSRPFISLVEHDRCNIPTVLALRWVEVCGGRAILLPRGDDTLILTPEERRCVEAWRGATPERRAALERLCDVLHELDDRDLAYLSGMLDAAAGAGRALPSVG